MSGVNIKKFDKEFNQMVERKNIKESHLLLIAGLSDGNIHHARY